jgi:PST family polysaccharide transporter/lipopolysaccharide exporter
MAVGAPAPPPEELGERATRAVLWRALELGLTRLVSLVRFLVLARLLAPEDFGLLAIAAGVLELLMTLTEVGVTRALVQRPDATQDDYDVAWTIGVARSVLVLLVVAAAAPQLAGLLGDDRATALLRVLALQPLVAAFESARVAWLLRHLRFSPVAGLNLGAAVVEAVVAVALAPVLGVWALVIAALVSSAGRALLSYVVAPHRPRFRWERRAAAALLGFGKWVFLGYVFAVAGDFLLRAAVGRRLGAADLGLFYLAARLAYLPNQVVAELVTPVAFSVHAQLQSTKDLASRAFLTSVTGMALLLAPVTGVLVGLASPLADDVLGPSWAGSAPVLALLAVVGLVTVPVDAAEPMLEGQGHPERVAWLRGVRAGGVLILAWWLTGAHGLVGAAVAALVAEVMIGGFAAHLVRGAWLPAKARVGRLLLTSVAAAVVAGAVARGVEGVLPGLAGVLVGAGTGLVAGLASIAALDRDDRLELRPVIAGALGALRPS